MKKKHIFIILFLMICVLPLSKIIAQNSNAGFIKSNIWYSQDTLEEGDKVKIYTVIFNPESRKLSGTVSFFDKTVFLGKKSFSITGKNTEEISIDWTVQAGSHTIFGKIENAQYLNTNGTYEDVYLAESETDKSSLTISKKIIANTSNTSGTSTKNTNTSSGGNSGIENIKNIVLEKTPDFIAAPIIATALKAEGLREELSVATDNKKDEIQAELDEINGIIKQDTTEEKIDTKSTAKSSSSVKNQTKNTTDIKETKQIEQKNTTNNTKSSSFEKPLKQVELFFLKLFSYLLKTKILFYAISSFIIFMLVRFIWHKFF